MPGMNVKRRVIRNWLAGAVMTAAVAMPAAVSAQVVVIANGSPITELDIQQRTKLTAVSTHKTPTRQEVISDLIDDRLKLARAKTYGMEVSDADVDAAFENMARRQHVTVPQFSQVLERSGIAPATIKARIRAEIVWGQLVRGKFASSLQVADSDISNAMKSRADADTKAVGYIYTLYPITVVVAGGPNESNMDAKRREADSLRSRFVSCTEGLAMARALRDVAVRDPIRRSSADLTPQLRELLGSLEVGRLTTPEVTAQGLQMFALCEKKESSADSSIKRDVREEIFNKRFDAEAKKFLEEIRKQAMIEYK